MNNSNFVTATLRGTKESLDGLRATVEELRGRLTDREFEELERYTRAVIGWHSVNYQMWRDLTDLEIDPKVDLEAHP